MSSNQSKPPVKYMMYCRKSTKRQQESLPAQERELKDVAESEGLHIVDIVAEAHSAYKAGRPKFKSMIERIKNGEANGLLVWTVSRLGRNLEEATQVITLLESGVLAEIRTIHRGYTNNAEDKSALGHDFVESKASSDKLSEVVKRGMRQRFFERKLWIGCPKPGYKIAKDYIEDKSIVVPNDEEFPLIRKAIELILSGSHTPMQAFRTLNDEYGYRSRQTRCFGGKPISKSAWQRLLNDPFYYGLMVRSEGEVIGSHIPMITQEEFDLLQIRLGKKGKPRYSKHNFPFKSVLRCDECKGSVTCQEKWQIICPNCKKKFAKAKNRFNCPQCDIAIDQMENPKILHYVYYSCTHKTNPNCTQKTVKIEDIETQILDELSLFEIPTEFRDWAIDHLQEVTDEDIQTQTTIRENLLSQYTKIDKQIQNCVRQRLSRDPETYSEEIEEYYNKEEARLIKEKKNLKSQLEKYEVEQEDWIELTKKTFNFACYARHWFEEGDAITKTQILQSLGENLYLKDGKILIDGQKPFFLIRKTKEEIALLNTELEPTKKIGDINYLTNEDSLKSTWRRGRDSNPRQLSPRRFSKPLH